MTEGKEEKEEKGKRGWIREPQQRPVGVDDDDAGDGGERVVMGDPASWPTPLSGVEGGEGGGEAGPGNLRRC